MFAKNFTISKLQLNMLLLFYLFNTTLLFLPSDLARVDANSVIFIAVFWAVTAVLLGSFITFFGSRKLNFNAIDWYVFSFGNFIGKAISWVLFFSLIFFAGLEIRVFSEIVLGFMLPKTPVFAVVLLMVLIAFYCAKGGIEANGRLAEILAFFVFIPLFVVLIGVLFSVQFSKILPMGTPNLEQLWQGGNDFANVFQGFFLLLFVFPFVKNANDKKFFTAVSIVGYGIFVVIMVVLCMAIYGGDLLAEKLFPTLQMLERVSFRGIFMTRQDALVLWFWFTSTILFSSGMIFFANISKKSIENSDKNSYAIIILFVFLLAILPSDLSTVYEMKRTIVPYLNAIFLVVLPIVMLIIFFKKSGDFNE